MKMRKLLLIFVLITGLTTPLSAKKILQGLDLSSGEWIMVGVPLYNYNMQPLQTSLGAFHCKVRLVLQDMQNNWEFEEFYDDYCDYHYALKFYQNGDLKKSLLVNLTCQYITDGNFSYKFPKSFFTQHQSLYRKTAWSRIRYGSLDALKIAVNEINQHDDLYWYGDVKQYDFNGSFMLGYENLPWNANKDSIISALGDQLSDSLQTDKFYITTRCWYLSDDFEKMSLRLMVFCNQDLYTQYTKQKNNLALSKWRNLLSNQNFIQVMVIGINKERYFKMMREAGFG